MKFLATKTMIQAQAETIWNLRTNGPNWPTCALPLGLFTGRRIYLLTPQDDGSTDFSMGEEFTGPLAPVFTRSIPDLKPTFEAFAAGLQQHAEAPESV